MGIPQLGYHTTINATNANSCISRGILSNEVSAIPILTLYRIKYTTYLLILYEEHKDKEDKHKNNFSSSHIVIS